MFVCVLQLGAITSGISSVHTTASGHGIHCAIVGKYAKFTVTCRNHCNEKVSQAADTVKVNIYTPEGTQLTPDVIMKPDGVNHYSYYPSTVGGCFVLTRLVTALHA